MAATRLLRLVVAVGLTALVLYNANPAEVVRAAAQADLRWISLAVALVLLDRTLMALRWMDLLAALTPGIRPRFPVVLRIFFVSSFVSNFVPSVAADMYRAYELARHDVHLAESTASVLMDRVLGVLSMVIVGVIALPFAQDVVVRRGVAVGLAVAAAGCAVAALVVFSERAAMAVQRMTSAVPWMGVQRIAVSLTGAVRRYAHHHRELVRVLGMSILVQVIRILQAWCLGRSLSIDLPISTYFAFIPIIVLVMQLPFTINGLGTTQYAFEALFVRAGVAAAPTFALSVLFLALGMIGSLPGGLIYALSPAKPAPHGSSV